MFFTSGNCSLAGLRDNVVNGRLSASSLERAACNRPHRNPDALWTLQPLVPPCQVIWRTPPEANLTGQGCCARRQDCTRPQDSTHQPGLTRKPQVESQRVQLAIMRNPYRVQVSNRRDAHPPVACLVTTTSVCTHVACLLEVASCSTTGACFGLRLQQWHTDDTQQLSRLPSKPGLEVTS